MEHAPRPPGPHAHTNTASPSSRRLFAKAPPASFGGGMGRGWMGIFLVGVTTLLSCECQHPRGSSAADGQTSPTATAVERSRLFYQTQPPYLRPVASGAVPEGLPDLRAATCGLCHKEIYDEWRISTHARAWLDDLQFQAELAKPRAGGEDVRWMCVNCHTPLETQQPRLVVGLANQEHARPIYADNPSFDPELQREAITCATCHLEGDAIAGPWGDTKAPHKVRRSERLLKIDLCTRCHNAQASFPELTLACVFQTGDEFSRGPYAKEDGTCASCHMPPVTRPVAIGGAPRETRRHWFGGSLIPKKPSFQPDVETMKPHFKEGLTFEWSELPQEIKTDQETQIHYALTNANAGHDLPTGDPERFFEVTAVVRSTTGSTLAIDRYRIGSEYQWYPTVKKVSDNRLKPQEVRRQTLVLRPSPELRAAREVTLVLSVSKWRISEENLKYHKLEGQYVSHRDVGRAVIVLPTDATKKPGSKRPRAHGRGARTTF